MARLQVSWALLAVGMGLGCGQATGPASGATTTTTSGMGGATSSGTVGDGGTDASFGDGGPDTAFTGAPTCPSGAVYPGGAGPGEHPGEACIACHATGGLGPMFTFAGTVFANGHATDGCLPTAAEVADLANAEVIITGADNTTLTLPLGTATKSSNGNFSTTQTVPLPYTARVVYFQGPNMGKERVKLTPQMSGDCNACHTVAGASGAPGRIALPQ